MPLNDHVAPVIDSVSSGVFAINVLSSWNVIDKFSDPKTIRSWKRDTETIVPNSGAWYQ